VGTTGAFEILSIDPAQKRIGVGLVDETRSGADVREYAERQDAAPASPLGSMAENLRNAFRNR
jgi:hypothetical protein